MVTDRNGREKPGGKLVSERTRRNLYGSVANFFHWAKRKNYLPRERPAEIDYVDKPGKPPHIPQSFTADEIRKLLESVAGLSRSYACAPLLAYGALRLSASTGRMSDGTTWMCKSGRTTRKFT